MGSHSFDPLCACSRCARILDALPLSVAGKAREYALSLKERFPEGVFMDDLKEGRLCGTYADASRAQHQSAPLSSRQGHPRFYELLDRMAQVHDAKNHDYSGEKDPLRNLRQCGDAGVEPWVGVIVRLTDKMDRLKTYASKRRFEVKDEGLADTFIDMANYALLGLILFEEWSREEAKPTTG